jgi:hypothetical protein
MVAMLLFFILQKITITEVVYCPKICYRACEICEFQGDVNILALKMEVVCSSETLVYSQRLHGATTGKTII